MFDYKTNRVIGGICEYCGIKASECPHYKDKIQPLDYTKHLENPNYIPVYKNAYVEPLKPEEKAESIEKAKELWEKSK